MNRALFSLLLLSAAGCGKPDPLARTDDLPKGARRVAAEAMPTAEEIASACLRPQSECRDDPSTHSYCEPPDGEYLVRVSSCSRAPDDPAAADCRFATTLMAWGASEEAYRRLSAKDFRPGRARFVRVAQGARSRWITADTCP